MMRMIKKYCPFCDKEHDLELRNKNHKCLVKNKPVKYLMSSYYCHHTEEEFWSDYMINDNLNKAREAYKETYENEVTNG
jgi:hypothetical protein